MIMKEYEFYNQRKDWNFSNFSIKKENYTNWDLYKILKKMTNEESKILDLGTGGGERVLDDFPKAGEILGTDFAPEMIKTAKVNLEKSGKKNITFRLMDNLKMDTPDDYFDVVVARNTVIDAKQIYKTLKENGHIIVRGVDKLDCWELKRIFKKGQAYNDEKPISLLDYESILDAGFKDVELIPIHQVEYFESRSDFINFLFKTPILIHLSEGNSRQGKELDMVLLEKYIKRNSSMKGIRLVRRYYGIIGRK